MRTKRILPIALGGGLGGPIFIFILIIIFSPNVFVKGMIMKKLEKSFGGRARAEEASFGWKKGVVISKLFIQDEKGEKPILKIDNVHLQFAVLPLLKGKMVIHRLEVNRPEMVIYRNHPKGQKGPSFDGAPELEPGSKTGKGSVNFPSAQYSFPTIIEADINEGIFIFTDLSRGESTSVENFNLTLTGLKPGEMAQINGECDIFGGGGQDHAVITGTVEGFELARLEALKGELVFKSGFADVQAAVDMSGLNIPGTKVLKASLKGDSQEAITRLGAILPLPEDAEIRGRIDSDIDAVAQSGGTMLLEGQTSAADLFLKAPPLFKDPFNSSYVTLFHRAIINPNERSANIEKFMLSTDNMNIESSGTFRMDGIAKAKLHLKAPLEEMITRLAPVYGPLGKVMAIGDLRSDIEIDGTIGKTITLKGTSKIKDLGFESKSFQYADPKVTVQHDLDYDQEKAVVKVRNVEVASGLLVLALEQGLVKFGDDGYHQGKLSLLCNMEEATKWYKLPMPINPKGVGRVALDLEGPLASPFYKGIKAGGTVGLDEAVYNDYKITKIITDNLVFEKNRLNTTLNMEVNGGQVETVLDVDLAEGKAADPHIKTEIHASNVPVTHAMRRGGFSGVISLDAKASGEGLKWDETLKKTLAASGNIRVKEGRVRAAEVLSAIFMALGHPGNEYYIDSLESDFNIEKERINTKETQIKGNPFDMNLSGWVGFDKQIDYNATVFLPKERIGKDIQKIFAFLGDDSAVPLRITGRLSKPRVQISSKTVLEGILRGVLVGPEEAPKEPEKAPKKPPEEAPKKPEEVSPKPERPESLLEAILKGLPKEPEKAPEEPKGAPKDPEKVLKELEEAFKDIFK